MARKPKSFWLCVTVAVFSIAALTTSYGREFGWKDKVGTRMAFAKRSGGSIGLARYDWPYGPGPGFFVNLANNNFMWRPGLVWTPGGFSTHIPLWIPFLIASAAAVVIHRRSAEAEPGTCAKCGYNLTGNESGVCPECGTPRSRE